MGIALAAANRLVRTANLPNYDANYCIAQWINFSARPASGEYHTLWSINRNSGGGEAIDSLVLFGQSGTDTRLRMYAQGNGGGSFDELSGSTNLSPNTWYYVATRRSANNSRITYLGTLTALLASEINFVGSYSGRTAPTRLDIGAFGSANGDPATTTTISNIIIWAQDVALATLQNQQQFHKRPMEFPVNGAYPHLAPGILDDPFGGNAWTAVGTPVIGQDPPISW